MSSSTFSILRHAIYSFLSRQYIVPFTSPTITLVLTQGPALKLSQPERAFQTLVEAVARLSDHDQAQQLPPDAFTLAYGDCIVGVANPAGLEAMSYGAAVSSFRGLGEFMLENSEWKNEQEVRISIDDDIVGTMLIKNNPGSGSAETM